MKINSELLLVPSSDAPKASLRKRRSKRHLHRENRHASRVGCRQRREVKIKVRGAIQLRAAHRGAPSAQDIGRSREPFAQPTMPAIATFKTTMGDFKVGAEEPRAA